MRKSILFLTEKYANGEPAMGLTNSFHNLFSTCTNANVFDHTQVHFDHFTHKTGKPIDDYLLDHVRYVDPTYVFVTLLFGSGYNPKMETLQKISERYPLVFVWFDTVYPPIQQLSEQVAPFATLNITLDRDFVSAQYPDKYLFMWTPQDHQLYDVAPVERTIDVSFAGSITGNTERQISLARMHANGIPFVHLGGQHLRLTHVHYASLLQLSKISISFPRALFADLNQLKGRVFEITQCGALLLDRNNEFTSRFFEPGKEYVTFEDDKDLVDKVRYYLDHEDERDEIAYQGRRRVLHDYSNSRWWTRVLDRLERKGDFAVEKDDSVATIKV